MKNKYLTEIKAYYDELYPERNDVFERITSTFTFNKMPGKPEWMYAPDNLGMSLYVDLYAGDFESLKKKIGYWQSMAINLVHLLPIQAVAEGNSDGGYAVKDYRDINQKFGDLSSFKKFVKACNKKDIHVCIDFVVNHTSNEHEWAVKALSGDQKYMDYYNFVSIYGKVKQWEVALPEVFPNVAPGNFTYIESLNQWVMTVFYPFQWDLNYRNPEVFFEMLSILFYYAELGVSMIRLDAIPYIWKAIGTESRNLPEVHLLVTLFRKFMALKYPDVVLLGEVIVDPYKIPRYFGSKDKPGVHMLYHASYMVEMWDALATGEAGFLTLPCYNEESYWIRYARCHDDIGWGLEMNWLHQTHRDPQLHKEYLMKFYRGDFYDSFAIGEYYEYDEMRKDARISGTMASLCGLEKALNEEDEEGVDLAIARMRLLFSLILFRRGIPMLYQGDDFGYLNNWGYQHDPEKRRDSRWVHRMPIDWETTQEGMSKRVNDMLREVIGRRSKNYRFTIIGEEVFTIGKHVYAVNQQLADGSKKTVYFNVSNQWINLKDKDMVFEPYEVKFTD